MKGLFLDATPSLTEVFRQVVDPADPAMDINEREDIAQSELPALLHGYDFMFDDHTTLTAEALAQCKTLKHVIFLGTGARSFIGYGGIAAEVARIAHGSGMRVIAWNRTPKMAPNVEFLPLEEVLAQSQVLSLHLLLNDETRGFLSADRIAQMRPGAILVNTARGAVVDEAAMIAALKSGHLRHAALDVFDIEPLPHPHPLQALDNVTLTAHSAFRTPEANQTLIRRALDIAKNLKAG